MRHLASIWNSVQLRQVAVSVASALALGACAAEGDPSAPAAAAPGATAGAALSTDPGALLSVSMPGKVGVLLDEVPAAMRDRVAAATLARPASFWIDRAKAQLRLTTYRLVFREFFYGGNKKALPLPPETMWQVTLKGNPYRVKGAAKNSTAVHDTVQVDYTFTTTILTDAASPGISEAKLAKAGGTWDEPFTLPMDPELLVQRTGYACMDEEDFPLNSVDTEETDSFYDQDCKVEKELSPRACHQTVQPAQSCRDALVDHVGKMDTLMRFTRLAWNAATANAVRVGPPASVGADLEIVLDEFEVNRLIYRYIKPGSCELTEQCVGGTGWRRLLQFATSDRNIGDRTLFIGAVDYYLQGIQTLNDLYHIFEFDACHEHYHFLHYGKFAFGDDVATTTKRGFCLQSTNRLSNKENSPLHNPFGGCDFQGVEVGWVDQYKAGLPCQWIDVTDVDTSGGPVTKPLSFTSNPDGFLCEGVPVLDAAGNPVFEPTAFQTDAGETVQRPKCDFTPGWFDNNTHAYDVTLPTPGHGYVTEPCTRGQLGSLRNCGFSKRKDKLTCAAGLPAKMTCSIPAGAKPQVVRVCERSAKHETRHARTIADATATAVVEAGSVTFDLACPGPRDPTEPGGAVSVYSGAVFPDDASPAVTCTIE